MGARIDDAGTKTGTAKGPGSGIGAALGTAIELVAGKRRRPASAAGKPLVRPLAYAIVRLMRAALVLSDVLADSVDPAGDLDRLENAGLRPVVVVLGSTDPDEVETGGYPTFVARTDRPECWSDEAHLLARAAARAGAHVSESALICHHPSDVEHATTAGCRAILVLGSRTLDDVYGPMEPRHKSAPAALTLTQATDFLLDEIEQERELGPFPYGAQPVESSVRTVMPSKQDIAVFFGLVTFAGIAIALGVAYLLQEAYQTIRLPPIAYWITLQFIDQTWRGVMFLIIGVMLGAATAFVIPRILTRQRAGRA